jgi:broad specificity phosphatase PhoE
MMARLFLIRHGEPEAAWGGEDDDPGLSEAGKAQAAEAAAMLAGEGTLAVLTSPKRRCQETAAPYLEQRRLAKADLSPRFGEVESPPGVADRRAWLMENFPWRAGSEVRAWSKVAPELRAWRDRVISAARAIDRDTVVFTHFIAMNAIVGDAKGSAYTVVFRPDYASITELEVHNGLLSVRELGVEMGRGEVL